MALLNTDSAVGVPRLRSSSDDEASGPRHDAADPAALLPLQPDWLLSPKLRHVQWLPQQGEPMRMMQRHMLPLCLVPLPADSVRSMPSRLAMLSSSV